MNTKIRIFISAIYISPPNTMGGNSKIILELINNLSSRYQFIVFTSEPETFKKNIKNIERIKLISVPYPFKKLSFKTHLRELKAVNSFFNKYFEKNEINEKDYFYSCSDFAPDVLPIVNLKKRFKFNWIASLYLFIPNPIENLFRNYKFPFLKYIVYFVYQKYLFFQILKKF